jgi:hypothetical protein
MRDRTQTLLNTPQTLPGERKVLQECADPNLARLIEAWPTLSDTDRAAIVHTAGIP